MAARAILAEEAPFAAARAAVEDAQLRSDELRFSELQPRSYHEAAQLQAVRQKIQRLRVQAAGAYHQDPDIYGDDGAWLGLRGSCFDSPPLTEKSVLRRCRGSRRRRALRMSTHRSAEALPTSWRELVFRVCPFKNVTQREADHLEWKRATARAEGKKLKRSAPPEPVVLGEFQVWAMTGDDRHPLYYAQKQLVVAEASSEGARQIYAGGIPCAGDRQRVAIVRPVCAAETKLVRVDEDGVCSYLMDLETPAARAGVSSARVRDLEQRLSYPLVFSTARSVASVGRRFWRRAMLLLLRATGRRPVGEWVPRVERSSLIAGRGRSAWFGWLS